MKWVTNFFFFKKKKKESTANFGSSGSGLSLSAQRSISDNEYFKVSKTKRKESVNLICVVESQH